MACMAIDRLVIASSRLFWSLHNNYISENSSSRIGTIFVFRTITDLRNYYDLAFLSFSMCLAVDLVSNLRLMLGDCCQGCGAPARACLCLGAWGGLSVCLPLSTCLGMAVFQL